MTRRGSAAATAVLAMIAVVCFLAHRQWESSQGKSSQAKVDQEYADPATCAGCHSAEAAGYATTGMAHAFYKPSAKDTVESSTREGQFFHAASGT